MTTELIKELVGLAVEKLVKFEWNPDDECFLIGSDCDYRFGLHYIFIDNEDAPDQLQAAIDKVKSL
tara:strand:- start:14209 stop:14406 length:198 start_codon:yes stop_codon:yes gene_type:complete